MTLAILLAAVLPVVPSGNGDGFEVKAAFAGERPQDRGTADFEFVRDMCPTRGVSVELKVDDLSQFSGFSIYFQSGDGWYSGRISPTQSGVWQRLVVDRAWFNSEGSPAGWHAVRAVRISGWRGGKKDCAFRVRNLKPLSDPTPIVILHDEGNQNSISHAHRISQEIGALGLSVRPFGRGDLVFGEGTKLIVMPCYLKADRARDAAVAEFEKRGGKVFKAFNARNEHVRLTAAKMAELLPETKLTMERATQELAERNERDREWIASLPAGPKDEFRAFWCHSPNGMPGMSWDSAIQLLAKSGFNAIIVNLAWGGWANLEKFDEIKTACRKHGVKMHVWKVCWHTWWGGPKNQGGGDTQIGFDGKEERWLCPSDPRNLERETALFMEIAKRDPDGLHFDYIRYPDNKHCFCYGCRERFERKIGEKVKDWPKDVKRDARLAKAWQEFRVANITALVREVSRRVRKEKPGMQLSAAVFENCLSTPNSIGQDWKNWCEEGWLDFVCPMDYCDSPAVFESLVAQQKQFAGKVRLYPGIGLSSTGAKMEGRARRVAEMIKRVREQGVKGFTIFNFDRTALDVLPQLAAGPCGNPSVQTSSSNVQPNAKIAVVDRIIKTYPFSDEDVFPVTRDRRYPYSRFDGSSAIPEERKWEMVVLENNRTRVVMMPEVGGKVWAATDKKTGEDYLYCNHVLKFRDIALRGPWVSGGIEFNFGTYGHAPSSSTPVDWFVRTNADKSVSCFVSSREYATRTVWQVEVRLGEDDDHFETHTTWFNCSGLTEPLYHWMNAAYSVRDNPDFLFPGTTAIGHAGKVETRVWPKDSEGHEISVFEGNAFGGPKSRHFLPGNQSFYGIWWPNRNFGSYHRSSPYEKFGRKMWLWSLSREGGIWEDLLTDDDGQYTELQSGIAFNQPQSESALTPFKHTAFSPGATMTFSEEWGPIRSVSEVKPDMEGKTPNPRPDTIPADFKWDSANGLCVRGIDYLRERNDQKGAASLRAAIKLDPNLLPALTALMSYELRRGNYGEVHRLAKKALSLNTYDGEANYTDGFAAFAEGDMVTARERLGMASIASEYRSAALAAIARTYLHDGNCKQALLAAEKALKANADNMDAIIAKAVALRGTARASEFANDVLAKFPLMHAVRYERDGADNGSWNRFVRCELPAEEYKELGWWYAESGFAEDARRLFALAGNDIMAKIAAGDVEGALKLPVFGARPFRREELVALEKAKRSVKGEGAWKVDYLLAVAKSYFNRDEEAGQLLEGCGEKPTEAVFYRYRATFRKGEAKLGDLMKAASIADDWRIGMDIVRHCDETGDKAKGLKVAADYLKRFPGKNQLQIAYAQALNANGKFAETVNFLKGVTILPSEMGNNAASIWHEAQDKLGQKRTWPENLGKGEPYPESKKPDHNYNPVPALGQNADGLRKIDEGKGRPRVLVIGNSITRHGPRPDIGWTNDFGMAASCIEKDFAHVLIAKIKGRHPNASLTVANVAGTVERKFQKGISLKDFDGMRALKPDIVVMFFGANCPGSYDPKADGAFGRAVEQVRNYIDNAGTTRFYIAEGFYDRPKLDAEKREIAVKYGDVFVPMDDIRKRNDVRGRFNHPSDNGMRLIAERFWEYIQREPPRKLLWSDEFNGSELDRGKWGFERGFERNREYQYYTDRKENVRVENGLLVIEGRRENFPNDAYDQKAETNDWKRCRKEAHFTSGSINTWGKFDFAYGRLECRAKLPKGNGAWPAIWTLGADRGKVGYPKCGEIDIMEFLGQTPGRLTSNIHGYAPTKAAAKARQEGKEYHGNGYWCAGMTKLDGENPTEGFHIYAAEWSPDGIAMFYDGKEVGRYKFDDFNENGGNCFRKRHYLLLNLALGAEWMCKEAEMTANFPLRYEIDWVRVYER